MDNILNILLTIAQYSITYVIVLVIAIIMVAILVGLLFFVSATFIMFQKLTKLYI